MVLKKEINGKTYYQCEECEFYYKEKEWAEKCEEFCNKYHACGVDITKHSVEISKNGECSGC